MVSRAEDRNFTIPTDAGGWNVSRVYGKGVKIGSFEYHKGTF